MNLKWIGELINLTISSAYKYLCVYVCVHVFICTHSLRLKPGPEGDGDLQITDFGGEREQVDFCRAVFQPLLVHWWLPCGCSLSLLKARGQHGMKGIIQPIYCNHNIMHTWILLLLPPAKSEAALASDVAASSKWLSQRLGHLIRGLLSGHRIVPLNSCCIRTLLWGRGTFLSLSSPAKALMGVQ